MSLYKDASLVMIPSAVKDGKLYSIRPIPEYGSEKIINGSFDTDTAWTKGTGWTISGGTASCDGTQTSTTNLNNTTGNGLVNGKTYRVVYTISGYAGGSIRIKLGNAGYGVYHSANGTYTQDLVAGVTTFPTAQFNADANFVGSIDNVSVQEIVSSGDFTFSRGSNLAATRVDVNGLIEKGRENLLLQSNSFDEWSITSGSSITSGQSGYDGSNDAWLMTDSGFNSAYCIYIGYTYTGVQTFSLYAKQGGTSEIEFDFLNGSGGLLRVDLTNGSVQGNSSTIDYNIEDVGNGWWRLSIAVNNTTAPALVRISCDGAGSVYIQDAQVELGLVATSVIETGASTAQAGILEDLPRLDYSGGASCPSLLLEPSRTNIFSNSEYFGDSFWLHTGTSVVNGFTSPEGTNNAYNLVEDTSTGNHTFYSDNISVTFGSGYTYSCYVKKAGRSKIRIDGGYRLSIDATFNLDTLVVTGTGTIETLSDGWFRLTASGTGDLSTGNTNLFFYLLNNSGTQSYTGDGTSGVYLYGAQLELGSYPTSYIPTMGSAVTRSGDDINITDFQSNGLFGSNAGTIFLDLKRAVSRDSTEIQWQWKDDSNAIALRLYYKEAGECSVFTFYNNRDNEFITITSTIGYSPKIAISYDGTSRLEIFGNGTKLTKSGGNFQSDVALDKMQQLSTGFNITEFNQILFFPTALTDSECIALTTI